jgi:hypothetical protein
LIERLNELPRGGNLGEQLLAGSSAAAFLVEDRLAKIDALAADINVARSFDQRSDIAIALATERTKSVFLGGSAAAASGCEVTSCRHFPSFPHSPRGESNEKFLSAKGDRLNSVQLEGSGDRWQAVAVG